MSQGYKFASGLNVALGSLVDITMIKPTGDEYFIDPKVLPLYDDGIIKTNGVGGVYVQGFAVQPWYFSRMTYKQYDYLRTTYCSGGLSGDVTVLVNIAGSATLTRMNAKLVMDPPAKLKNFPWYDDVTIRFTRLRTPT